MNTAEVLHKARMTKEKKDMENNVVIKLFVSYLVEEQIKEKTALLSQYIKDTFTGIKEELDSFKTAVEKIDEKKQKEISDRLQNKISEIDADLAAFKSTIKSGENYVLTDADKAEIARGIEVPVVEKEVKVIEKIVREQPIVHETVKQVVEKEAIHEEPLEIAGKLNLLEEKIEPRTIKGFFKTIENLQKELKRIAKLKSEPYLHGSGLVPQQIAVETPSGAVDGNNRTYTVQNVITRVITFAINGEVIHPADYTFSGKTITMNQALPASLSSSSFSIVYV